MTIHTIKLPDVGEGVTEAEFVELHVALGDHVEPDQNLADVMTDKATVEVPSPRKGKVVWIGAEPGEVIAVGAEIIKLELDEPASAETPPAEPLKSHAVSPEASPSEPEASSEYVIKLPDVGEGVTEAEFVELHVAVGDTVEPDQNLADVMTDKASVEIPSPRSGTVTWIGAEPGQVVAVGAEIIKLSVSGGPGAVSHSVPKEPVPSKSEPTKTQRTPASPVPSAPRRQKVLAAPAVRARAITKGVDLNEVVGSGPAGRVTHSDLDRHVREGGQPTSTVLQKNTQTEEVKIIGLRRKIAEKMQAAKRHIPHITYVDEVDMTALEDLRRHMNTVRKPDQPKLTVLPFIARAIIRTLDEFPQMNAHYDDERGVVTRFGAAHIGVATQTDQGLMVPVVRHAEGFSVWQIANEISRLSAAARAGSATREELSGSSITITSLGPLGGVTTTPIINRPEVAIVGPNKIQTLPRFNDQGQVEARKVMNLSSSFDHRIIDGYEAAEFVQRIKAYLEFPATLFIQD